MHNNGTFSYVCPRDDCAQLIPRLYVEDYRKYPACGCQRYRASGARKNGCPEYACITRFRGWIWAPTGPIFICFPINDASLEVVFENANSLEAGKLPPPNPKIFPEPTLLQVNSMPYRSDQGKATLLFYDTAGEAFLRTQDIGRYAGFVRRAKTVLFLVSIPQLRSAADAKNGSVANPAGELERLLYSYIQGMADMNADTRDQHLIIVYTCADALLPELNDWPLIQQYIAERRLEQPQGC